MSEATLTPDGDGRWALGGVLDFTTVPRVWPALERELKAGGELVVSLAGVSRANSAALAMLVEARDLARRSRCALTLANLPADLLDLARMSRCDRLLAGDAG